MNRYIVFNKLGEKVTVIQASKFEYDDNNILFYTDDNEEELVAVLSIKNFMIINRKNFEVI